MRYKFCIYFTILLLVSIGNVNALEIPTESDWVEKGIVIDDGFNHRQRWLDIVIGDSAGDVSIAFSEGDC